MATTVTRTERATHGLGWKGAGAIAMLLALLTTPARAQEMRFAEAVELLEGNDPDGIQLALETLGARGEARAVQPIAARIRGGLPAELADLAVMTLGMLGRPEAGPVLFELLSHRRAELRQIAVEAIAATKPRGAGDALVRTLSDGAPGVRSAAALGLGQLGHAPAIDPLFHALELNVIEAGQAIGQLAKPEHVDRLFAHVGRVPLDILTPAFNELFARDDFPERAKVDLVGRLAELATPEVKTYLTDLADTLPEGRVKAAATDAAERITG